MTKHKHTEMIKAKADNMELVVFIKTKQGWMVQDCNPDQLNFSCGHNYFLCLPQHNENGQCLHWLNGGYVIVRDYPEDERERVLLVSGRPNWHDASVFMCERAGIRIKPKKEKRYIGVKKDGYATKHFATPLEVKQFITRRGFIAGLYETIEIEV